MLNPAVVFAEVAAVFIVPSVLELPVPFAFQAQLTNVEVLPLTSPSSPKENPSLLKAVTIPASLTSASVF